MRHKLTLIACVILFFVLGILCAQSYNRHRVWLNRVQSSAVAAKAKAAATKNQAEANFDSQVNNLQALCKKDLQIYQALPATQKAKQQQPDCNVQFVQ